MSDVMATPTPASDLRERIAQALHDSRRRRYKQHPSALKDCVAEYRHGLYEDADAALAVIGEQWRGLQANLECETELRREAERELARERRLYCDKPDDRLWHAEDATWWRRAANGRLVRAEDYPPPGAL